MSHSTSSSGSEDKGFSAQHVSGNVTYITVKGDHITNVSVEKNIETNNVTSIVRLLVKVLDMFPNINRKLE